MKKEKIENRPIFAFQYDPRLPALQNIQNKHWRAMVSQDQYLAEVFPEPPLTAFRKQRNIRDILIKAKLPVPAKPYPTRQVNGMVKCGKACTACPFILEGKTVTINSGKNWQLRRKFDCDSYNIIYIIECNIDNCKSRYIGMSSRSLRFRLSEHRGYVTNKITSKATGAHFNLPGHGLQNMKITILEIPKKNELEYRKQREKYFINKFNTLHNGMNRQM